MFHSITPRTVMLGLVATAALLGQARADAPVLLSFPAGDLITALESLARQTGIEIVYSTEQIRGLTTAGVSGEMSPRDAVSRLLRGTSLEVRTDPSGAILIVLPRPEARTALHGFRTIAASPSLLLGDSDGSDLESELMGTYAGVVAAEPPAATPSPGAGQQRYVLEDITVTATKIGETRLQSTPISLTALTARNLEDFNVSFVRDLSRYIPNVQFEWFGPGQLGTYIRGVGTEWVGYSGEASTNFYVDGVLLDKQFGVNSAFFDLERIEVLRGPQGTLYGRNATAGAVNIITTPPTDELTLKVSAQAGNYNHRQADATISGPMAGESVKGRLTVSRSERDGYIDNLTGPDIFDENYYGLRGTLEFTPSDHVDIFLRGDYFDDDSRLQTNRMLVAGGASSARAQAMGYLLSTFMPEDFWSTAQNADTYHITRNWGGSGALVWRLPRGVTLRSITAYRESYASWAQDTDSTPVQMIVARHKVFEDTFTQELQLDGSWNRLKWVTGLYYLDNDEELQSDFDFDFLIPNLDRYDHFLSTTKAWALFANLTYDVTERLSLEAGARYGKEEKDLVEEKIWTNLPFPPFNVTHPPSGRDWDNVSPRFGVNYKVTDDALLYASFSRGFKSGMYMLTNPIGQGWVEPEELSSYEIGFKTDWLDRRLRANAAFFYYDYQDLQVRTLGQVPGTSRIQNAAESTIKGVELELAARPVPALTLNCAVGYLKTEFDKFLSIGGTGQTVDVSGNQMPQAPEFKVVLGAQYGVPVADYGSLTFRFDLSRTDKIFFDQFEDPLMSAPAHTLLDGLVRFETTSGAWAVELYGKNLTEEEYWVGMVNFLGDRIGSLGPPRVFGLQVTWQP